MCWCARCCRSRSPRCLGVAAVAVIAVISPAAAAVLAACLLIAGVAAPWLAARAATAAEAVATQHHSGRDVATMLALEHAPELRVSGRLDGVIAEAERRHRDWGRATDRAAAPAALAAAAPSAGDRASACSAPSSPRVSLANLGRADDRGDPDVVAAVGLRGDHRAAGRRGAAHPVTHRRPPAARPHATRATGRPDDVARHRRRLAAVDLASGYAPDTATRPITLTLESGARLAVTGPSGSGKTTLLMAMAGLGDKIIPTDRPFFAEDAHLFATTVRDNLLVVRGDATDDELRDALRRVGLAHLAGRAARRAVHGARRRRAGGLGRPAQAPAAGPGLDFHRADRAARRTDRAPRRRRRPNRS